MRLGLTSYNSIRVIGRKSHAAVSFFHDQLYSLANIKNHFVISNSYAGKLPFF